MPSRDRRLKLPAKQQAESGTATTETEEPENVTIRKAPAKAAKAAKGVKKKEAAAAESNGNEQHAEPDAGAELADGESATARSDGQQYLTEDFAPKKNKKIEKLALDYEQKRDSRMAQGKLEVAARKLLIEALHASKEELFKDENGRLIYKFPGEDKQVILDNTEKVSVKTVKSDDDEEVY